MTLEQFMKGQAFDPATLEKVKQRQLAIARWSADELVWVKYYQAMIPCEKPDLNKYLNDPKYVWPRPTKPLPPAPPRPV